MARPYDLRAGSLAVRLKTVLPTIFLGVPRVWEKIMERMQAVGAQTKGLKKAIATWAKAKSLQYERNSEVGGTGMKPPMYDLAEKLVLKKVREALGLQFCKVALTGRKEMSINVLK